MGKMVVKKGERDVVDVDEIEGKSIWYHFFVIYDYFEHLFLSFGLWID